jgi:hypothetical protein
MIVAGSSTVSETATDGKKNSMGQAYMENRAMRINRAARTGLGVAAFCWLPANVGCNGAPGSSSNASGTTSTASATTGLVAHAKQEGDWAMSLLSGGNVGLGMFPAKFNFDISAASDCTNDFVAYNTSFAGAAAVEASRIGTFSANLNQPAIYQLSFTAATGVLSGVGVALTGLVTANNNACSPVTEIYNPNGGGTGVAKDWIFFSIGNNANTVNPIPAGTCQTNAGGCLISIDVTGTPPWPPTVVTNARSMPVNANGSTSGIVVDNVADTATSPQASSIYLSYGVDSTGTVQCNSVTGTGCAVKLTQSALQ